MFSGIKYVLVGVVQDTYNFRDDRTGEIVRGVNVGWMGGEYSFKCADQAEFDRFPPIGESLTITGVLVYSKGKAPKFRVGEITVGPPMDGSKKRAPV